MFTYLAGEVTKFGGTTYAASPMRVLVRDGFVHLVDGDSQHRQLLVDSQSWEAKEKVNLSDIKMYTAFSVSNSMHLCVCVCVCVCVCAVSYTHLRAHETRRHLV